MGFTKLSPYLLIVILSLATQTLGHCPPSTKPIPPSVGPVPLPPINVPPIIGKPPVTVPGIIPIPPITPIIGNPPITVPGIIPIPPVITPILPKPPATRPACPPPPVVKPPCPPKPTTCPVDTLKLGECLEILGAPVHVGDPAVECCPLIAGLPSVDAAACLCTTIKMKAFGIHVFFPIALKLLITCGKTPPPGYNCA